LIEEWNESYHSLNGAIRESDHVFIEMGLSAINQKKVRIFEMGFGTGLNALLSWNYSVSSKIRIHYKSIDLYPLERDITQNLNYPDLVGEGSQDRFAKIHAARWGVITKLDKRFFLEKIHANLLEYDHNEKYDLVYFDAFSPTKQPELWSSDVFRKILTAMSPGGLFVTYSSKSAVRRALQAAGFHVEKLPGPPGKREMIRAICRE
jgi:tRNA U34 5-methylaminomethyl-2-thiouridine-forming methyltransferase MnmC